MDCFEFSHEVMRLPTTEKNDGCNRCCEIIDFFKYRHGIYWDIIISNYDISLLQFLFFKNTVNLKECVAAVAAIIEKELFIEWKATTGIAN